MILRALRVGGLVVVLTGAACNRSSDAPSTGGGEPVKIAGTWRDAVGDAPWQTIEITERDGKHGRFAGKAFCASGPCPVSDQGDYELDGKTLQVHSPRLEGQRYTVHLGGDVMEWRQNDVMVRRFKREQPAPPLQPREDYPAKSAARPPGTPCDTLTAQGCLLSKECVLEAPPRVGAGPYVCRPAVAPCEGGVAQANPGFAADCKARGAPEGAHVGGGCTLRPGNCYCPNAATKVEPEPGSAEARLSGSILCACGGGPYQQCLRGK